MALRILVIVFAVVIVALLGVLFFYNPVKGPTISSISPTATSSMVSADGTLSVDAASLGDNGLAVSPLVITGSVRGGGWFFEATFPVKIVDGDGITVLGTSFARAESDWMSTGTVPFRSSLTFSSPKYATGTLILMNDNPSGDPSKLKTLIIPVRFK